MSTATRLRNRVLALLERRGRSLTLERTATDSDYDATTGKIEENSDGDVEVETQTAQCSDLIDYEQRFVDGDLVRAGDAQVYVSASGLDWVPTQGCTVLVGTDRWLVISVQTLALTAVDLAYVLQVRRGGP